MARNNCTPPPPLQPEGPHSREANQCKGKYLRRARYYCGEYTRTSLIFTPSRNGTSGQETHRPQESHKKPSFFFFGPDQDELAYPAHHMVLETT